MLTKYVYVWYFFQNINCDIQYMRNPVIFIFHDFVLILFAEIELNRLKYQIPQHHVCLIFLYELRKRARKQSFH